MLLRFLGHHGATLSLFGIHSTMHAPVCLASPKHECDPPILVGNGKRGHYERGLFAGGISRISRMSKISRISRKWSDSPLFSRVWQFSRISRISKFSRISRKWTFLKRPLFQKTPFPKDPFFRSRSRVHTTGVMQQHAS